MYRLRFFGLLALLVSGTSVVPSLGGCSSSPASTVDGCSSNPFSCGSGTTCAVKTCTCTTSNCSYETCTPQFACLASFSNGLEGSSCTNMVGAATCGDGLTCIREKNVNMGDGVCTAYCDSNNPCATGLECVGVGVSLGPPATAPVINVCQLPVPDGDIFVVEGGGGGFPNSDGSVPEGGHRESGLSDAFHTIETSPH